MAVAGGVSANSLLRRMLQEACDQAGLPLYMPKLSLCTDNGAMIAGVGYRFLERGDRSPWDTTACARVTEFKRGLKK